jgi:hypothetical protein
LSNRQRPIDQSSVINDVRTVKFQTDPELFRSSECRSSSGAWGAGGSVVRLPSRSEACGSSHRLIVANRVSRAAVSPRSSMSRASKTETYGISADPRPHRVRQPHRLTRLAPRIVEQDFEHRTDDASCASPSIAAESSVTRSGVREGAATRHAPQTSSRVSLAARSWPRRRRRARVPHARGEVPRPARGRRRELDNEGGGAWQM